MSSNVDESTSKIIQVNNLDNMDYTNPKMRLNSPRSIEAIRKKGIKEKDLFYSDFKTYKKINQIEFNSLPKEVQTKRWEEAEKIRQTLLKEAKNERLRLINEPRLNDSKMHSKMMYSNISNYNENAGFHSTAHENEKRELEKLKLRQKMEIQNMIEYEIKMEMIKKDNEDKLLKQKNKEEMIKLELIKKKKEEDEIKRKKEADRELILKKEQEEIQQINFEKYLVEKNKALLEEEKEKKHKLELAKQQKIQQLKAEEFKMQTEKILQEQQIKIAEKQKQMEEKEKQRIENLEKKRLTQIMENNRHNQNQQRRILRARQNLEKKIVKQQEVT